MKTTDLTKVMLLMCTLMLSFSCLFTTSCIKDADDDEQPTPPENDTIITDTTKVVVDSVFKASVEYLHGEWMGQYVGYDKKQEATSAIRRLVFFSPDGFYDSHVQGIVNIEDTITTYKEFEHEHGSYTFDPDKQLVTYTIEYDSLLNFRSDQLEYSPGKMEPGVGLVKEYNERIWFSREKENKRDWIRTDENLMTPDDHAANVIYIMKQQ